VSTIKHPLTFFKIAETPIALLLRFSITNIRKRLAPLEVYWPEADDYNQAVELFAQYHLSHQMGIIDVLIGQLAVSKNGSLYTFNKKHYAPIPGLKTIQPYRK
jgi:predicted nucleic acid-binding protein